MSVDKIDFLKNRFLSILKQIPSDTPPAWGKMTYQQMIEHFTDYVRIASGKTVFTDIITPAEHLERSRNFLMSEKPFKENTPNPLMPQVPAPVRNPSAEHAIKELKKELDYFFTVFEKNNLMVTRNPFFGDLNYDQNIQLLHKHAQHHLKQFGVTTTV
jgi:hypothetical protein